MSWMQLRETRKWTIKRESDGKDKSFENYVIGNGSLRTLQSEKGVLSMTAFWHFPVTTYVPTNRLRLCLFNLLVWIWLVGTTGSLWNILHGSGSLSSTYTVHEVPQHFCSFKTFVIWISGYLSVCESTELKTSSDQSISIRNSGTENSNRYENNMRCLHGNKKWNRSSHPVATTATAHICSLIHNRFH